jgi:hypothetical protein
MTRWKMAAGLITKPATTAQEWVYEASAEVRLVTTSRTRPSLRRHDGSAAAGVDVGTPLHPNRQCCAASAARHGTQNMRKNILYLPVVAAASGNRCELVD